MTTLKPRTIDYRHLGWLIVLLLHAMLLWWFGWRYQGLEIDVHRYFALVIPVFALVFCVFIFTPTEVPQDWSAYFNENRWKFFVSYTVFWVLLSLTHYVLTAEFRPAVVPTLVSFAGIFTKNRVGQYVVLAVMLAVFVAMALVFPERLD